MSTKALVPVEEYLRMSFEGPDPEYLDGELVERNLGGKSHGSAQAKLAIYFGKHDDRFPFKVITELHLRLAPSRIRIADVAVFLEEPVDEIPSTPPLIVMEIVSPGDRYIEIHKKLQEYHRWGVRHIWLLDPSSQSFSVYDSDGLREVPRLALPELELTIQKSDVYE
jgi:Uma2 family endonuclease